MSQGRPAERQSTRPTELVAQSAPVRNGEPLMSILSPLWPPAATQPRDSQLLRSAIEAHETKMADTADTRALVLTRLVMKVLGRQVDRMTYTKDPFREPIAIVDGLQFRGAAEDPYSLKGGWLVVRTQANGWDEVRSLEQLGAIAKRTPLALVQAS